MRKVKANLLTKSNNYIADTVLSPRKRSVINNSGLEASNANNNGLLSAFVVGNHLDWNKYQLAIMSYRKKRMAEVFRAWASYYIRQFSKDGE